jgi:phenylacetate-coenzyme A ligase PaaK-like adenylate-forming protein
MMSVPRTPLESWIKTKMGLPQTQALTRQVLTAYQLEKLRATLEYVKRRSPFYRRRLADHDPRRLGCLQDLAQLPLTTADDLRGDPMAFLCISQSGVERVVTLPTRCADDRPKRLFFSAADLDLAADFFQHGFSTAVAPGQRMLILMPCERPGSVGDLLARGLARHGVETTAHGPMHASESAVEAILAERVDCLVGTPAEMTELARYSGAVRIPTGQIKSVWLGTQNARRTPIEEISRFWGCPVYQHYGVAEMCPGGGVECVARDGFHLREADLVTEIVDPETARPVGEGAFGEVVVTTITREAMPLIRYRTGHTGTLNSDPCTCGSVVQRLTLIQDKTI